MGGKIDQVTLVANPFLEAMAEVTIAHLLLEARRHRRERGATRRGRAEPRTIDFYAGKVMAAKFFVNFVLPQRAREGERIVARRPQRARHARRGLLDRGLTPPRPTAQQLRLLLDNPERPEPPPPPGWAECRRRGRARRSSSWEGDPSRAARLPSSPCRPSWPWTAAPLSGDPCHGPPQPQPLRQTDPRRQAPPRAPAAAGTPQVTRGHTPQNSAVGGVGGIEGISGPPVLKNVQERTGGERVGVPEPGVGKPAARLGRIRGLHEGPRLAALEEAAQVQAAGAAHLDERELGHVVLADRALHRGSPCACRRAPPAPSPTAPRTGRTGAARSLSRLRRSSTGPPPSRA